MYDDFLNIEFSTTNLDSYFIRTKILHAIKSCASKFHGELLDVGCGKMPYRKLIKASSGITKYTGLDIETALHYDDNIKPDFTWDGITMPFENDLYNTVLATEVLEHCPKPSVVLNEINRVLKPGGIFFFTVPFLWPLHEVPHDEFRYTPFSLERLLEEAGFEKIEITAFGGWHAALAQMLGLWVRRAPLKNKTKKLLSIVFRPIIKYLINKDRHFTISFSESQMIPGLYGIAFKDE